MYKTQSFRDVSSHPPFYALRCLVVEALTTCGGELILRYDDRF